MNIYQARSFLDVFHQVTSTTINIHSHKLIVTDSSVAFWYVQGHRNGRSWVRTPVGTTCGASKTATGMARFSIMWQGPPIMADEAFVGWLNKTNNNNTNQSCTNREPMGPLGALQHAEISQLRQCLFLKK